MLEKNVPASMTTPSFDDQFVGRGHRIGRLAAIVLRDHLELLAADAAGGVDLLERKLPALAIGLGEGRQRRNRN